MTIELESCFKKLALVLIGIMWLISTASAQTSIPCGQTILGSISIAGEQDHYSLTAAPGDKATIRLIRTAGTMAPDFELYDSQGTQIGYSDNWTGSNLATLDIPLNLGGTYTLIASARGNADTGSYNLTWQKLNAPCNAAAISCGLTTPASISAVAEQDHYSLTAAANDNVTMSMVRTSGTMAPDFELYDSQGTQIGYSDNWTGSNLATLDIPLNLGGTYTLIAFARGNADTGSYNLTWQFSNKPCTTTTLLQFSSASYSVNENGDSATIMVTRTGGSSGAVGVSYATSNGTATAGSDYTAVNGNLSWADGDMANKTFTVPILNDTLAEGNETVKLALNGPTGGAVLGSPNTALLTIIDVPMTGTLQFSSAIYSVNENSGNAIITVTRTGGSSGAVGVSYATGNGTATAGSDYTGSSGTLSWANGDTASKTFNVPIINDSVHEGNETVNLSLSNPTGGATLGSPSTAILTIIDDDPAPAGTLQFSSATYSVNENGGSATITITRTGGSNGAVGVSYAISNGTATAGSDYTTVANSLSWANGDTASKTFNVPIINDSVYEGNETVNLTLSSPSGGATLGSPSTAILTIIDDDPANYTAIRRLARSYVSLNPTTVGITVTPASGTQSFAVEDSPPLGWVISEISHSGQWDTINNKVKWGPFFDNNPRTLTFRATPPAGETGDKTFNGTASFDGNNISITGDSVISQALLHQADTNGDFRIVIDEITAYGSAWKRGQTWPTPPNPIPISYVTNAGYIWKTAELYHYDPSQTPPWVPGSFITASLMSRSLGVSLSTRDLPNGYTPLVPQVITISVNPDAGVAAYAVEEIPPVGWVVSDINESGIWDDGNKKVKWGPFFDNSPRTLSYKATPPAGESGTKTFAGIASFDGTNLVIAGETDINTNGSPFNIFLPLIIKP
jgi:ribosomal protein L35AE/L33A